MALWQGPGGCGESGARGCDDHPLFPVPRAHRSQLVSESGSKHRQAGVGKGGVRERPSPFAMGGDCSSDHPA
eukprot:63539-Rhodomonas_salina.2